MFLDNIEDKNLSINSLTPEMCKRNYFIRYLYTTERITEYHEDPPF